MVQRRVAHKLCFLTRTLTSSRRLRSNNDNNNKSTEAVVGQQSTIPFASMSPFAMTSGHNSSRALAGAGIVALGAGAFLCARAYSSRSRAAAEAAANAMMVEDAQVVADKAAQNGNVSRTGGATAADNGVTEKSPCEGCDCGLMEPGPLEGTMHAYERHVIICRFVWMILRVRCLLVMYHG